MPPTRLCALAVGLLLLTAWKSAGDAATDNQLGDSSPDHKSPDLWGKPLPAGAVARMHATPLHNARHIVAAALAADGTVAAIGTDQDEMLLFDARTAKLLKINAESFGAPFLAFTPDGAKLVLINAEGALIVRDLSQDTELNRFTVAKRRIARFSLSANGKALVAVAEAIGEEPTVYVWDCDTGTEKGQVEVLGM